MKQSAKLLFGILTPVVLCFSCARVPPIRTTISNKNPTDAFGNLDFALSPSEFAEQGYGFGDMINIKLIGAKFGGGDIVQNVALVSNYNEVGYFAPCLCNYENRGKVITYSYGIDTENRDVSPETVKGNEAIFDISKKMGYKDVRDLVEVSKKCTYEETGKDAMVFSNFRDVGTTIGGISEYVRPGILFRGSSPFNYHSNPERCDFVNKLIEDYKVDYEISLGNTKKDISEYMDGNKPVNGSERDPVGGWTSQLWKTVDKENPQFCNVQLAGDYFTMKTPPFKESGEVRDGNAAYKVFKFISDNCDRNPNEVKQKNDEEEEPSYRAKFFIHCDEGKDRTGFICMVLEALGGATTDLLVSDFMLTFRNYYNITTRTKEEKKKYDKLAELTIYRFIYSLLIGMDFESGDEVAKYLSTIDWYTHDAKKMVEDKIIELKKELNIDNESGVMIKAAEKYIDHLNESKGNDDSIDTKKIAIWVSQRVIPVDGNL